MLPKSRYVLILALVLSACRPDVASHGSLIAPATARTLATPIPYSSFLADIRQQRLKLAGHKDLSVAKAILFKALDEDIPQYWQGTPWDFNGTTRIPRTGNIACGYFVTNVLDDLGFHLDRTKLAQQVSSVMIHKLCVNIHSFSTVPALQSFILQQQEQDVFIIGLDFHTGFIIKNGDRIYFLHSNYIQKQSVTKELYTSSAALNASHSFLIGSISANDRLMREWLRAQ